MNPFTYGNNSDPLLMSLDLELKLMSSFHSHFFLLYQIKIKKKSVYGMFENSFLLSLKINFKSFKIMEGENFIKPSIFFGS